MDKKTISSNRKAFHTYEILEKFEAGLLLAGYEVKSLRKGQANLIDGLVRFINGEAWLDNVHIPPYEQQSTHVIGYDPRQRRKLLLHRNEIARLDSRVREKGLTAVPLELFFSPRGIAKVVIGLAKGKRTVDKRQVLKERDLDREAARERNARR